MSYTGIDYFQDNNGYFLFNQFDKYLAIKIGVSLEEFKNMMIKNYNAKIKYKDLIFLKEEDIKKAIEYLQPLVDNYFIIKKLTQ